MSVIDLDAVIDGARGAAHAAAAHALGGYRKRIHVEHKGPVDLVTAYDRASEEILRERLGRTFAWPIVGEEAGGADGEVAFYVDPIDGTTNFIHGHPFWCISIGLVVGGVAIAGVVIAPALGIEWYGYADEGRRAAFRRSVTSGLVATPETLVEPCRPTTTATINASLLATGFPYDRRTSADNNFDAFVHMKKRARGIRRCGAAAIDLCLVADGTYDGYWERKLKPWDLAGGMAIVSGAGGRATDPDGRGSALQSGHIVATNGVLHGLLLDELARVRR